MSSEIIDSASSLTPSPRTSRSSPLASPTRGDSGLFGPPHVRAGASGDQAPINAIFENIAKRLERMGNTLDKHEDAIVIKQPVFDKLTAADGEQTKQVAGLDARLLTNQYTFKTETAELRRALEKGFEDLGAALDENFVVMKEGNADFLREIKRSLRVSPKSGK